MSYLIDKDYIKSYPVSAKIQRIRSSYEFFRKEANIVLPYLNEDILYKIIGNEEGQKILVPLHTGTLKLDKIFYHKKYRINESVALICNDYTIYIAFDFNGNYLSLYGLPPFGFHSYEDGRLCTGAFNLNFDRLKKDYKYACVAGQRLFGILSTINSNSTVACIFPEDMLTKEIEIKNNRYTINKILIEIKKRNFDCLSELGLISEIKPIIKLCGDEI